MNRHIMLEKPYYDLPKGFNPIYIFPDKKDRPNMYTVPEYKKAIADALFALNYNPLQDVITIAGGANQCALFAAAVCENYDGDFLIGLWCKTTGKYEICHWESPDDGSDSSEVKAA